MELCKYGCGQPGLFELKDGSKTCAKSASSCPVNKEKNSQKNKELYATGVKQSSWTDEHRATSVESRRNAAIEKAYNEVFILGSTASNEYVKRLLLDFIGIAKECQRCNRTHWFDTEISLELDHINGNDTDNRIDNLRLLCPNCHSLTPTWRGRNINTGTIKVTDDELKEALNDSKNIRQALLAVGLAAKGANYERAKRLLR